ncbi:sensor histidine kinase [Hymenobacter rubidus]|uniref:sensor histidine kinase n=1 Tax=Hymenobacter rubidus TaxID=1441626 RepID=UPI00191FB14D|nr:ATP-binding protein [Hymenobacter rubidus]
MKPLNEVAATEHPSSDSLASEAELTALREQVAQLDRLAAIGQLTAGILHEIKNPLNFISSFARLSGDLVGELTDFAGKLPDTADAEDFTQVLDMLTANLTRIRENGARAERIILGMLAQTRGDGNHFEPTDVNALVEDFAKLAYQGVRAGNVNFNVSLKFALDPGLGMVTIAPYEFNRVIMNLVLNACYAVNERSEQQQDGYKPAISISSEKADDHIDIKIRDNGNGISDAVKSKLFTPFFTTKPVGKGTGLGLSLSRNIVQELHKGRLSVESTPGEFTEFTIRLPLGLPATT